MKKKILRYIAVLFCFWNALGCSDSEPTDDDENPIMEIDCNCITGADKFAHVEYDYMHNSTTNKSYYTIEPGQFSKLTSAFYDRVRVNLVFNQGPNAGEIGTKIPWKIMYNEVIASLDSIEVENRNTGTLFYIAIIDHCTINPNPDQLGKTKTYSNGSPYFWTTRGYSVVFAGKIEQYPNIQKVENCRTQATAHELGHLIGVYGDNETHEGNYDDCCIMAYFNPTEPLNCIRDDFTFCDKHACHNNCFASQPQFAGSTVSISKSNLIYNISLNKDKFVEAEPILISLKVQNNGPNLDSVSYFDFEEFHNNLVVTNSEDIAGLKKSLFTYFGKVPYTLIKPNSGISITFELQEFFGYKMLPHSFYSKETFFSEGEYSVQLVKNGINSNKIKFIVEKPTDNESVIFNKLINIYNMIEVDMKAPEGKRYQEKVIQAKYDSVKTLVNNLNKNAYTEEIFQIYNKMSASFGLKDEIIDRNLWFIRNYPDSYFLKDIIYNTTRALFYIRDGDVSVKSVLNGIIQEFPNSKAANISQEFLTNENYKK
ncbi:MAG: hypothetical protein K8I03_16685 [Ignavibacteria bacterium]|nr:hypothetical protein [Ignavibacteria bacterium]